jgi:hypothetical protein
VTDRRTRIDTTVDDLPLDDVVDIQGDAPPDRQDAFLEPDEIEEPRQPTRTEIDRVEGTLDPRPADDPVALMEANDLDVGDLRDGETDDPGVAAEEGLAYVPPTDPLPLDADSEDQLAAEADLTERVRMALLADAATAGLVDGLVIATRGSTVVLRGTVAGIEDVDLIVDVAEAVRGVATVIDETELAA